MTQDMERADGISEPAGDFLGRKTLDKISAQSFIDAVLRVSGLEEETATIT